MYAATVFVGLLASTVSAGQIGVGVVSTDNSTIDPGTVDPSLRAQWCSGETNTCPILCGSQSWLSNDCDPNTLSYNCTCTNGTAPGLQYYLQTMPTFICLDIYQECIVAGQNNATAQKICTDAKNANCGTLDPTNYTEPASTSSSAAPSTTAPGTSGTVAPASATSGAATSTSKAAAATMAVGQQFGTGVLAAGVVAAFGYML